MRCRICGFVLPGSEAERNAREVALNLVCVGCEDEFKALKDLRDEKGAPVHTAEQAFERAKSAHHTRQMVAFDNLVRTRRQRVAAGFSAIDGTTPLAGTAQAIAKAKAEAQKALDAEAAAAAFRADLEGDPK